MGAPGGIAAGADVGRGAADGRPVLVLQHAPAEGPALIARALRGIPRVTRIVLDEASPDLPDPRDVAAVVAMGGPMNVDDPRYPGLAAERRLLADAVDAGVPVLGVCLGMQLLARALGARVHPGAGWELGFAPVDVVAPDPVLAPLGERPTVLHWHGDHAELPAGATLLATSAVTPVQAFRAGSALGLQFHLEVDGATLHEWLRVPEMVADLATHGIRDLTAQADAAMPALVPRALEGLAAFADAARARR